MFICPTYVTYKLNSLHRYKSNRIVSIKRVIKNELEAVKDSIDRYRKDYYYLNRLTQDSILSATKQNRHKSFNVYDKTFSAFEKWVDVYPKLEIKKVDLNIQMYSNKQNALISDQAFNVQFALLNVLLLTEAILCVVYLTFGYVINLSLKENFNRMPRRML